MSQSSNLHVLFPVLFSLFDDENMYIVECAFNAFCYIFGNFKQRPKKVKDIRLYRDVIIPNISKIE